MGSFLLQAWPLLGKWDRCVLVSLGLPARGQRWFLEISLCICRSQHLGGRAGEGQGYSLLENGASGILFGQRNVLGSVVSGVHRCMGITDPIVLVNTHPCPGGVSPVTGQGCSGQFFGDRDRFPKVSLPFWRSCREAEQLLQVPGAVSVLGRDPLAVPALLGSPLLIPGRSSPSLFKAQ